MRVGPFSEHDVRKVTDAVYGYTNPFSVECCNDDMYCLSSGVPAKPDVAVTQLKAERNIFGQLVMLSVQNDIGLELTPSYLLGPVFWALATADGMSVKTDACMLMHYLETSIEQTTARRKYYVVYIFDGNAMLQI